MEVSDSMPKARGSNLPVVTRRTARNSATVQDGGTVALAGLKENRAGSNDKSVRETAIFVTAHLVRDVSAAALQALPAAQPPTPTPASEGASASTTYESGPAEGLTPPVELQSIGSHEETQRARQLYGNAASDPSFAKVRQSMLEYQNADPHTRTLMDRLFDVQRGLHFLQQTLAPTHFDVVQKKALRQTLQEAIAQKPNRLDPALWEHVRPRNILFVATLISSRADGRLDAETAAQVFGLAAQAGPAAQKALSMDTLRAAPVQQVLQRLGEPLPAERFSALLKHLESRGFVSLRAEPAARIQEDRTTTIRGPMTLSVLGAILDSQRSMLLDIQATAKPPTSARTIEWAGTPMVPLEKHTVLPLDLGAPGADRSNEVYCLIVKPTIVTDPEASLKVADTPGRGITATFTNADLLAVLAEVSRRTGVKITPDATVKATPVTAQLAEAAPETALQQVLKGTPYLSRKANDGTYLVFRPLSFTFPQVDLVQALQDLSAAAGVPIILDPNVTGTVNVAFETLPLDEALQIVLAGRPCVFKKMPHYYLVADRSMLSSGPALKVSAGEAPLGSGEAKTSTASQVDSVTGEPSAGAPQPSSRAWHIMRQWNCPPLLLGLTQQFAKVLEPSRRNDPVWQESANGGTLRLNVAVEGDLPSEVIVGLFRDARWSGEPVVVRRLGAGAHMLTGLPAGQYQIGAMIGNAPVPSALGVHRTWPEAVAIKPKQTATADVLVSEAFQKWASGWYNEGVTKDYLGQWGDLSETNLLQGQLTGPDGRPISFGMIEIREHNPGANSSATADQGTNEQGIYKYDGMDWPYQVTALWREAIPWASGYRRQRMYLSRVLEGPQRLDFRFEPFPEGTAKVAGRLVDQNGKPVKGFFLRVHMPPFNDLDLSHLTGGYKTQVTYDVPFISEDGRFELGGLPAGRATVVPVPFEVQRYQQKRGKDITLEAGETAKVDIELVGKGVFHGRVLFEDGTPAVITPAPWRGAVTRILMTFGPRAGGIGEVGPDGYFTIYLGDSDTEALALDNSRLVIDVPTDQERRWDTAGEFPFEKLAEDQSKAGVVLVKRPRPAPMLPAELRPGGPLPPG
jgi:hypothetical protein